MMIYILKYYKVLPLIIYCFYLNYSIMSSGADRTIGI